MPTKHSVYLEVGRRRVFAGAVEWPGWCRSGRDEHEAVDALVEYGPRYSEVVGRSIRGFTPPKSVSSLEVVERLPGDATTDFGAPGSPPSADERSLDGRGAARLVKALEACWIAFDEAVESAEGVELRKGPRGGGREVDAMVQHVLEADGAYLSRLGGVTRVRDAMDVRRAFVEVVKGRAGGSHRLASRGRGNSGPRDTACAVRPGTPSTTRGRSRIAPSADQRRGVSRETADACTSAWCEASKSPSRCTSITPSSTLRGRKVAREKLATTPPSRGREGRTGLPSDRRWLVSSPLSLLGRRGDATGTRMRRTDG